MTHVWVVSSGHGYYAESVWSTEELAWAEARRQGYDKEGGRGRSVKRWEIDQPEQIWADEAEDE